MSLDWTPIITAAIGGAVGFGGGWFSRPAAKGKVDEKALKKQHQRKILADARQMVSEATQKNAPKHALANDPRFLAVRGQLDEGVVTPYKHNPWPGLTTRLVPIQEDHTPLVKNLDRLEKKWGLV